jgi:hypothetical protein
MLIKGHKILLQPNLKPSIVKKISIFIGMLFLIVACKGPLAKPGATVETTTKAVAGTTPGATHIADAKTSKEDIKLDPAQGGITIAELYSNKKSYSGKVVRINGKVTKVNTAIMGKNWIHIQDGTESGGQFDLTITSNIVPNLGDVFTFEGTIALDKDFGYGYTYPVMMEEGKIVQ